MKFPRIGRDTSKEDTPNTVKLQLTIKRLLATQDKRYDQPAVREETPFEKDTLTETSQGTPEEEAKPVVKRKKTRKTKGVKTNMKHCFPRINGHIYAPLCGPHGHLKRLAKKVGNTLNRNKYSSPALGLMAFESTKENGLGIEYVDLGPEEDIKTMWVFEQRNLGRPPFKVMIEQPYEYIENRLVEVFLKISRVAPLTGPEIEALLIGMRDFDGFGPSSRGKISNISII